MTGTEIGVKNNGEIEGCLTIFLKGKITSKNANEFHNDLTNKLPADLRFLIIDLSELKEMASAGLSSLIHMTTTREQRGGLTVLVNPQPKIKSLFDNLGIVEGFVWKNSAEEAQASLKTHLEKLKDAPRMLVIEGPHKGTVFPLLSSPIRVGSDPRSTISLHYATAEFQHAEIYRSGDQCHIKDLGSKTGVYLKEQRIYDETLNPKDVVTIGKVKITYLPQGEDPQKYLEHPASES